MCSPQIVSNLTGSSNASTPLAANTAAGAPAQDVLYNGPRRNKGWDGDGGDSDRDSDYGDFADGGGARDGGDGGGSDAPDIDNDRDSASDRTGIDYNRDDAARQPTLNYIAEDPNIAVPPDWLIEQGRLEDLEKNKVGAAVKARFDEDERVKRFRGFGSTILTGGQGITTPANSRQLSLIGS